MQTSLRRTAGALASIGVLCLWASIAAADDVVSYRQDGDAGGFHFWQLPAVPGETALQSWSGAGSTPAGEIFVAGMDHVRHSACMDSSSFASISFDSVLVRLPTCIRSLNDVLL